MRYTATDEDRRVRPSLRVIGALGALLIAMLMLVNAHHFFSAGKVALKNCASEIKASSRLLCHLGNEILRLLPESSRGWVEGVLHVAVAGALLYGAWRLIKPLFRRNVSAP
jgi:hypothetical protein